MSRRFRTCVCGNGYLGAPWALCRKCYLKRVMVAKKILRSCGFMDRDELRDVL